MGRTPPSRPDLSAIRDEVALRLVRAIDSAASRLAGRPVSIRVEAPLGQVRRGRVLAVDAEISDLEVGGLVVDHLLIRITDRVLTQFNDCVSLECKLDKRLIVGCDYITGKNR